MKVDKNFNQKRALQIPCNYTQVAYRSYDEPNHEFVLTFYGTSSGGLRARMNALEAHRLVEQLNAELAKHTKRFMVEKP